MKIDKPMVDIVNKRPDGSLPQYFNVMLAQQAYSKKIYSYRCDTVISNHDETSIASQITSNVTFSVVKVIQNKKILV